MTAYSEQQIRAAYEQGLRKGLLNGYFFDYDPDKPNDKEQYARLCAYREACVYAFNYQKTAEEMMKPEERPVFEPCNPVPGEDLAKYQESIKRILAYNVKHYNHE